MKPIGKQYTSIKLKREDSKAEAKTGKPQIFEKFRSSGPERPQQSVYLVERKAEQIKEKEVKTNITLTMLKAFSNNSSDEETDIEMFHFLRQATGLQLDGIEEEGLREITKFLLQVNDLDLIKSILEKIKPSDVQKVFKLLLKYPELTKADSFDRQILNTIMSAVDPAKIIEYLAEHHNLWDLSADDLNMILALENPVEILAALSNWEARTSAHPLFLKGLLISPEPLKLIALVTKHPSLSTLDITDFHLLLATKNLPEMLKIIDQALDQGMNIDIIKSTFETQDPIKLLKALINNPDMLRIIDQALAQGMPIDIIKSAFETQDPFTILKALINAPELWKGQPPEKLDALNKLIRNEKLDYKFEILDPEKFGKEAFTALTKAPDPDDIGFKFHQSKDGRQFPVAAIFYQDLNRLQIALGDNPYWNDPDNPDDPLLSHEDLTSETTPQWKKKMTENIRSDAGYVEGGDAEANKIAMQKFETTLTRMSHEWKERKIQQFLKFCGYVEGGDPLKNQKAEQKAFMLSCNCTQNIAFRINNASFSSNDTPLALNNNNRFMLRPGTYDHTLNLSKNQNGDILLTTTMKTTTLSELQEFPPKRKIKIKN